MSHSHLILEERIVIELFVHRSMSCREIEVGWKNGHQIFANL
jgi:hypothetical protein